MKRFLRVAAAVLGAAHAFIPVLHADDPPNATVLTNVAAIRRLTPSEAESRPDVRLKGVVTYANASSGVLYLQDASGGIYIWPKNRPTLVSAGELVEVEGVVEPGEFAPAVRPSAEGFHVLGQEPLPPARTFSPAEVNSGAFDGQFSECEGIVQNAERGMFHWRLSLWTGLGRVQCLLPADAPVVPGALLDASVRVKGVGAATRGGEDHPLQLSLYVTSTNDVAVVTPPPEDPFNSLLTPVRELVRLSPVSIGGHRVKIAGLVSLTRSNGDFFVEDPGGGVLVRPAAPAAVQVGDRVEVAGFAAALEPRPVLEQVVVRALGRLEPPARAAAPTAAVPLVTPPGPPTPAAAALPGSEPASQWPLWALLVCAGGFAACVYVLVARQGELRREQKRLLGAMSEASARMGRLQRAADVEHQRAAQQEHLLKLGASRTLEDRGLDAAVQEVLGVSVDLLRASHAAVWLPVAGAEPGMVARWTRPLPDEAANLAPLSTPLFEGVFAALQVQRVLAVPDVQADPLTQSFPVTAWHSPDVSSVIDVPILREGEVWGVLRHEHAGPVRDWTRGEVEAAVAVGEILTRLLARDRQSQSERALRDQLAIQQGLASWAVLLMETPPARVPETCAKLLQSAARMAEADVAEFGALSDDRATVRWVARAASDGGALPPGMGNRWEEDLAAGQRGWLWERLLRGESVLVTSVANLPVEAASERRFLEGRDCRSAVYLPVVLGTRVCGVLSCCTVGREHPWPDGVVSALQAAGRLMAGALASSGRPSGAARTAAAAEGERA